MHGSKITVDYGGAFHKGYLGHTVKGSFWFKVRQNACSRKIEFMVPLPDFKCTWTMPVLLGKGIIIP